MNKGVTIIEISKSDRWIIGTSFGLIITSILLLMVFYNKLPAEVSLNFNWPTKDANGLGPKSTLWIAPVMSGVFTLFVIWVSRIKSNKQYNSPGSNELKKHKEKFLLAGRMLRALALIFCLMSLLMTVQVVLESSGYPIGILKYESKLTQVLIFSVLGYFVFNIAKVIAVDEK